MDIPRHLITDKAPTYGGALALLKREGKCPLGVEHHLNNVIECDHADNQSDVRLQIHKNRLCHNQGYRGDARVA